MNHTTNHFPTLRALSVALIGLIAGCGGDDRKADAGPGDTLVFQSRQSVQCGSRGLTPQQGAQTLINGGIDVMKSGCGGMTNVSFAAVCGAGTGDILLHEIRKVNLRDAEHLGLQSTATLKNPTTGAGYVWVNCETGEILP